MAVMQIYLFKKVTSTLQIICKNVSGIFLPARGCKGDTEINGEEHKL